MTSYTMKVNTAPPTLSLNERILHELNDIPQIRNVLVGGRAVDIEAAVFDYEAALPNLCSGLIGLRFLSQLGG